MGNLSFYNRATIAAPTGIFFYCLLFYYKLQSKDPRIKVGAGGDILWRSECEDGVEIWVYPADAALAQMGGLRALFVTPVLRRRSVYSAGSPADMRKGEAAILVMGLWF